MLQNDHDLPDFLRERKQSCPFWLRMVLLAAGSTAMLIGVVLWLLPAIPGSIPFYLVGLVCFSVASERSRRWINRIERKLPGKIRLLLRKGFHKIPLKQLREMAHPVEKEK